MSVLHLLHALKCHNFQNDDEYKYKRKLSCIIKICLKNLAVWYHVSSKSSSSTSSLFGQNSEFNIRGRFARSRSHQIKTKRLSTAQTATSTINVHSICSQLLAPTLSESEPLQSWLLWRALCAPSVIQLSDLNFKLFWKWNSKWACLASLVRLMLFGEFLFVFWESRLRNIEVILFFVYEGCCPLWKIKKCE